MITLSEFKLLLQQYIDSPTDINREGLLATCKKSVDFTRFALTYPQFVNKLDAQTLYDLYMSLKTNKAIKESFYQDATIAAAEQCCASVLIRAIYNKNDLNIIKKIFEEKSVTVELTALQMFTFRSKVANVDKNTLNNERRDFQELSFDKAAMLLPRLKDRSVSFSSSSQLDATSPLFEIKDNYGDEDTPPVFIESPLSFKTRTLLLYRCNQNLDFALACLDRFPDLIRKLESHILVDIYLELSKYTSMNTRFNLGDEKSPAGMTDRNVKIRAVHNELNSRYGAVDDSVSSLTYLRQQSGMLTEKVDTTLKAHIKNYHDRINIFGIRKSKISRALFAELNEFVNEEGLAAAEHISQEQQLDKQCELYHILHGYMSNKSNQTRAFYNELKPLYDQLGTNLGTAYDEFKTVLEKDDVKRENYYKARAKRIVEGYKHDERNTKSTVSKQLVGTLDGLIEAENDDNKSSLLLPQYAAVVNAIGKSLQLSLDPLMTEIQKAPTLAAR